MERMLRITYTATFAFPIDGKTSGIYIKQLVDGDKEIGGDRRTVGEANALATNSTHPWTVVKQYDGIGEVVNNDATWGIFTPGQFNCMCIIVAIFDNESDRTWSRAWLTHVSSQYAPEVNQMIAKLDAGNHHRAHVAIGGQRGAVVNMKLIMEAFAGTEVPDKRQNKPADLPPYPQPPREPVTCLVYAGGNNGEAFGFGLSKDGFVGEVTGQLPKQ